MDVLMWIFCGLGVLLMLFAIPLLVDVLPASVGGLLRSKELIHFENTMSLSRERDLTVLFLMPLFLVALTYYRVLPSRLVAEGSLWASFGWTALFLLAYFVFRNLCFRLLGPKTDDMRVRQVTGRSFFTFFVLLTMLMLLTYVAMLPFHQPDTSITLVFRREIEAMYLIFLLRKFQILQAYHSPLKTVGFFFSLEILPTLLFAALLFFF